MQSSSSGFLARLWRIWIVIAVVDFVFATCLSVFAYGSTFTRLWQGVASTVFGPSMVDGGPTATALGVVVHAGVALLWSTVFLVLTDRVGVIRKLLHSLGGIIAAAIVYGPAVWESHVPGVDSADDRTIAQPDVALVVPTGAHIPFVAFPIVYMTARTSVRSEG